MSNCVLTAIGNAAHTVRVHSDRPSPEYVTTLAKAMREAGVRSLKCGGVELELFEFAPAPPVRAEPEESEKDQEMRRAREYEETMYASSGVFLKGQP